MAYPYGTYPTAGAYYPPPMPDHLAQLRQTAFSAPATDIIWVLNETEATSYPVAPNNTVTLFDKSKPVIYIKSANVQGVPSMRILDYTERSASNIASNASGEQGGEFVRLDTFNALQKDFEALKGEIGRLKRGADDE